MTRIYDEDDPDNRPAEPTESDDEGIPEYDDPELNYDEEEDDDERFSS